MPIQVQGPDGQTFEFPDGTDQGVMRSAMQKHYGAPKQSNGIDPMFADAKTGFNYGTNMSPQEARGRNITGFTPLMSSSDRADVRAAQRYQERVDRAKLHGSLGSAGDAISGAYHGITGAVDSAVDLVSDGYNALTGNSGKTLSSLVSGNSLTPSQLREQDYRGQMADSNGAKVGDVLGNLAMFALPASKLSKLGAVGRTVGGAALGAAQGGLQPVADGESRGKNAAFGAAFGSGGELVGSGLSAIANKAAAAAPTLKQELMGVAQKYGIPLHASQVSDSRLSKLAASASKYLPFSGAGKAAQRQQAAWDDALSQTLGNAPGADRPLSDAAMFANRSRISGMYNDVYGRNNVGLDNQALTAMTGIHNAAQRDIEPGGAKVVSNQLDRIINEFANGPISGNKYQSLRSALGRLSANTPGEAGKAIGDLKRALDAAAQRSLSGADAQTISDANQLYRNLKIIESGLAKRAAGSAESISPASLWSLANGKYGSTPEIRDLARVGQVLLKDPIPDSGTAGRNLFYGLAGLGGVGSPFIGGATLAPAMIHAGAGATIGRTLNSPLLARLMLRQNPGKFRGLVGDQLLPIGALGAAPLVSQAQQGQPNNGP